MKKNYILTLLITFCLTSVSFAQEMMLNGGLENWDSDTAPTDWTKVEEITKESTEVYGGSFSAKHVGGTKDLGQTIAGIVAGNSYTITIWYKVVEKDATDSRIWSYWKDANGANVNDAATDGALRGPDGGYLDNNGGVWSKYETTVIAPVGATQFYFELRTYSGAVTYWDDISFVNNTTASVKENQINGFKTYPNPVSNGRFTITSSNSDEKEISIFNILGRQMVSQSFSGTSRSIEVNSLNTGVYILKVKEGNNVATKKLVIR